VNYYKIHFKTLFLHFLGPQFTPTERDTLVRQVVDFSAEQTKGFVQAYMEVFNVSDPNIARDRLKGC
jgi:hypothetical protein